MSERTKRRFSDLIIAFLVVLVVFTAFHSTEDLPISVNSAYCAVYNGNADKNEVALLFVVYNGENNDGIKEIAEALFKNGSGATFFVSGSWVDDNEDVLKYLIEKKFEIGNYGFYNRNFKTLSEKATKEEIVTNHELVKAITSYEMKLFMPPNASFSSVTLKVAEKYGYKTVLWTVDALGDDDFSSIFKRATSVKSGDFVLLNCSSYTSKVIDKILDYYNNTGLTVKSVSDLLIEG